MIENAKAETQSERQPGELHPKRQLSGEKRLQGVSWGHRDKRVSPCREIGDWGNISQFADLLGGIIEQLLESERERIEEIEQCIESYSRERLKVLSRIEKLEELQAIALSSDLAESLVNQSESSEEE